MAMYLKTHIALLKKEFPRFYRITRKIYLLFIGCEKLFFFFNANSLKKKNSFETSRFRKKVERPLVEL